MSTNESTNTDAPRRRSVSSSVRILVDQRDKLFAEQEALKNKIDGLNLAISLLEAPRIEEAM